MRRRAPVCQLGSATHRLPSRRPAATVVSRRARAPGTAASLWTRRGASRRRKAVRIMAYRQLFIVVVLLLAADGARASRWRASCRCRRCPDAAAGRPPEVRQAGRALGRALRRHAPCCARCVVAAGGPRRGAWLAWEAVRARRRSPARLQRTRDARVHSQLLVGPRRCAWRSWARVGRVQRARRASWPVL